jgi:hypothetical protein
LNEEERRCAVQIKKLEKPVVPASSVQKGS